MKLLLFGGTFDPPHIGHMQLLKHAIAAVQPDLVLVMPAGLPPHKRAFGTSGELRFAMCADFLKLDQRVRRSRYEISRPGKSYTAQTVEYLQKKYQGAEIYLAMGSDMLLSFTQWYRWQWLLQQVVLVAQSRDDDETAAMQPAIRLLEQAGGKVLFVPAQVLKLSSSELREKAAKGEDISPWLPDSAQRTVRRHHLYQILQAKGKR
ncbi:MAG: nicotinate (nicotinamide) nucleotide adenylyltransferase [Pygmaiobacter massiliensis]|nr:nicotinate (nicotinamide) nucleotide adenylyltransferase [Pygmaiobacter massiliensis]